MRAKLLQQLKTEFRGSEAMCYQLIGLFQLLANKGRFRIICLLARGEFCVKEIVDIINAGKLSNISQQLKALTLAGVIERRREDRKIIYRLKDERLRRLVDFLRDEIAGQSL